MSTFWVFAWIKMSGLLMVACGFKNYLNLMKITLLQFASLKIPPKNSFQFLTQLRAITKSYYIQVTKGLVNRNDRVYFFTRNVLKVTLIVLLSQSIISNAYFFLVILVNILTITPLCLIHFRYEL
jgi:subtilase family serine protease